MFAWLKKLFSMPQPVPPEPSPLPPVPSPQREVPLRDDLFDPAETLIYTHLKGYDQRRQKVYVSKDPVRLYRRVMEYGQEISINSKVARSASKGAPGCWDKLTSRLREVFEIPAVEEGGLPGVHLVKLLNHFMDYCDGIKKNLPTATTSASATSADTHNSEPPTAASPQDTTSGRASGSTVTATSSGTPTPSSSESPSPSETHCPA